MAGYDDRDLTAFEPGKIVTLCASDPILSFRVDRIETLMVWGTQWLGLHEVRGVLMMDHPVCILRKPDGTDLLALTLRRVSEGRAFIQVSYAIGAGMSEARKQ